MCHRSPATLTMPSMCDNLPTVCVCVYVICVGTNGRRPSPTPPTQNNDSHTQFFPKQKHWKVNKRHRQLHCKAHNYTKSTHTMSRLLQRASTFAIPLSAIQNRKPASFSAQHTLLHATHHHICAQQPPAAAQCTSFVHTSICLSFYSTLTSANLCHKVTSHKMCTHHTR